MKEDCLFGELTWISISNTVEDSSTAHKNKSVEESELSENEPKNGSDIDDSQT